jgi:hypothetical protein
MEKIIQAVLDTEYATAPNRLLPTVRESSLQERKVIDLPIHKV